MGDENSVFERFVTLAKRELQADDVRLLSIGEPPPEASNVLVTRLDDGRHVVASFGTEPKDRQALERRLSILASTFSDALAAPPAEKTRARPRVATSLHEELKALAVRARAVDVVVIDTDSPVVWGYASLPARPRARNELLLREVTELEPGDGVRVPPQDVVPDAPAQRDSQPVLVPAESSHVMSDEPEAADESEATRRAIAAVRRLPALDGVHKGRHLRHVERDQIYYLALSFSGIYILCLVFDGDFDELRAERAAADALPRIERLVLALPPLDPDPPQPMGGVIALRRRR